MRVLGVYIWKKKIVVGIVFYHSYWFGRSISKIFLVSLYW